MLSTNTIDIIKSTVPILKDRGTEITKRFYERLFTSHPELLHIFNHANQKQGRQQAALANAVYAAAAHIDQLPAILPVVKQIAHKHRSLGVKAEHYPIVGQNLLAAMKDVLGDAATDEILQAWADAYGVIASVFIEVEQSMYDQAEGQDGGWEGFRAFVIQKKVKESDVITSFYLVPQDGKPIAGFEPGQYVSVQTKLPDDGYTHIRQYSLSDAPGKPYYRISVKREDAIGSRPAGKVSTALHEKTKEGDVLLLSAPAGDFTLNREDKRPVVLISGGVGLTPMVSMLNTLVETQPQRPVTFIHSAQNGSVHAMKEHVNRLAQAHPQLSVRYCYAEPNEADQAAGTYHREGYVDADWLKTVIPSTNSSVYFCGPQPFMAVVNSALKACGVADSDLHYEFFGPAASLEQPALQTQP